MKGTYWIAAVIILVAGALAYVGFNYKTQLLQMAGMAKPAALGRALGDGKETGRDKRNPQEKLADSIAQQQSLSQQANQAASASANEVQRTLKTIEDINRMNKMNQQLQQQQQMKSPK